VFPTTVTTLRVMDADGKNLRRLSTGQFTGLDPVVMSDGRVICMRWEYVDKGFGSVQSLWSMRPDGSHADHVYKNTVVLPTTWTEVQRSAPNEDGAGPQSAAVSHKADVGRKKIHGIAAVHEAGSACLTVPADKNLFVQALDEDYMELQRMRTFINLMPGEKRSCLGCREPRSKARAYRRPVAMGGAPQTLCPQPGDAGPRLVHYALDVQPTFDKYCLGCHSGREPKGEWDLSGELTELWSRSYETLIEKKLVSQLNGGYGAAHVRATPPLAFGSHRSKLVARIRKAPCKANLTREELIRIVTWIDANVPYSGTHQGKKNLKWKDRADFRPLPVAAK